MYDVIIKNGRVYDGSGNPWFVADVAITGDKIAAIGRFNANQGRVVVDAHNKAVAPGFIDMHTHSDGPLVVDGRGEAMIRQGVTTQVTGNCGSSMAPVTDRAREAIIGPWKADFPGIPEWSSMGEYLVVLDKQGISTNMVPLTGHGMIRNCVMGYEDREPTPEELAEMKSLLRQAMEQGAFGLSSGLIYVPGSYAKTDELIELCKVVHEFGGHYATHIRGENDTLIEATREAIDIGAESGVPVQIAHFKAMGTHMWGKSKETLAMVDDARSRGIDVTCDQYPYTASATGLGAFLPGWAHVGGRDELVKRLSCAETRVQIKNDIINGTPGWVSLLAGVGWDKVVITSCPQHDLEGKDIAQIAKERGREDFDTAFDLLIECKGRVSVIYYTICEEDIERIMAHPAVMIGSDASSLAIDGPLHRGKPHPRAFGTFVRVLGHYSRDRATIPLEQAVAKMTSLPAQKLRLYDRGLIRPGMAADVVVFDPATVADNATYMDPFQYPAGIEYVWVNGVETIREGNHTGAKAGKVFRNKA